MAQRFKKAQYYTQKYAASMEPCPFCGGQIVITSDRMMTPGNTKNIWLPVCPNCGDCGHGDTSIKRTIASWNSRAIHIKKEREENHG